jgi:hypothetical protein
LGSEPIGQFFAILGFPPGRRHAPMATQVSMPGRVPSATCLEQEPGAPLGLVNPNFDEAGSRNVLIFFADAVGLAEARSECLAVVTQLGQHVLRLDV